MKLKLKNTPEQVELIKAMGSRDAAVANEASQAFAAFVGPVVREVLMQAGSASLIYSDMEYDEDDSPSLPLDLYYDEEQNYITVWSQAVAGGLPTSEVSGMNELKITTYRLDSAVSFLKRYTRRGRLDVVSKALERMSNEVLIKQERNAWAVVLKALAEASTNSLSHCIGGSTESVIVPHDINRLMTRIKRINTSYADGTPANNAAKGITDMFVSPEIMQQVRAFAYNPVNSTGSNTDIPLTDNVRDQIWNSGGMGEIYGVTMHELLELGAAKKYNTLFKALIDSAGSTIVGGGNTGTFVDADDEILVGVDLSRDAFVRPVARQAESGGTFSVLPDDQFVSRQEKQGFYGFLEEGRVCVDARAVVGLVI